MTEAYMVDRRTGEIIGCGTGCMFSVLNHNSSTTIEDNYWCASEESAKIVSNQLVKVHKSIQRRIMLEGVKQ